MRVVSGCSVTNPIVHETQRFSTPGCRSELLRNPCQQLRQDQPRLRSHGGRDHGIRSGVQNSSPCPTTTTGRRDRRTSRGDSTTTDGCPGTGVAALRRWDVNGPLGTSPPASVGQDEVRSISQIAFSMASRADNASSSAISNRLPAARPSVPPSAARTVARIAARSAAAAWAVANDAACSLTPHPSPLLLPAGTGRPFPG